MFLYSAFHIAAFLWTEMDMVLKSNSMKQIVHTINQDSEQFKYAVFKKWFFYQLFWTVAHYCERIVLTVISYDVQFPFFRFLNIFCLAFLTSTLLRNLFFTPCECLSFSKIQLPSSRNVNYIPTICPKKLWYVKGQWVHFWKFNSRRLRTPSTREIHLYTFLFFLGKLP